jgi:hypothetical protein
MHLRQQHRVDGMPGWQVSNMHRWVQWQARLQALLRAALRRLHVALPALLLRARRLPFAS